MKIENLNRANEIQERLCELNRMKKWLETPDKEILILASTRFISDSIAVSEDMRTVLHGMCIGEIARLEKEFEEL